MARVSARFGWGRFSPVGFALGAFFVALAAGLYVGEYPGLALMMLGFAALTTFFALVHPDTVLATDDDDDPRLKVGDRVDD
jgi:hypothetical protein